MVEIHLMVNGLELCSFHFWPQARKYMKVLSEAKMGLEVIFPDGRQQAMRFPDDRQSPGHGRDPSRHLREPGLEPRICGCRKHGPRLLHLRLRRNTVFYSCWTGGRGHYSPEVMYFTFDSHYC